MGNKTFTIGDFSQTKEKVLNWAQRFNTFSFLDNHQYQLPHHTMECLLAAGVKRSVKANAGTALQQLQALIDEKKCWLFGHLGYDLKNELESLTSSHPDKIGFPDLYFFEPEIIIRLAEKEINIEADNPDEIFAALNLTESLPGKSFTQPIDIKSDLSREEYINIILDLKKHIVRGDCYEINFCHHFFSTKTSINPLHIYKKLNKISPNPFAALYKINDLYLICASPERFLKKEGNKLLSQPIKGTSRRDVSNNDLDEINRKELYNSAKDRSENVMVVDIVRNDLARVCEEGTVQVDELFGIYSFPQVHQMVSSISGKLKTGINFTDIIKATFPMGSMTGAPKKRVMELIEKYESIKRGVFSGAVGYISPDGDFDFNVVIRSILYNAANENILFPVGSGITFSSDPGKEWEECLLKAAAMKQVLEAD